MSQRGTRSVKSTLNRQKTPLKESFKIRFRNWWANKTPVLWFALKFAGFTLGFFGLTFLPGWDAVLSACLYENARLAGAVLVGLGEKCQVSGASILLARGGITVESDCSAFECVAFYCAAVLAFPVAFRRKIPGLLAGVVIILAANLVRIASLLWVKVHFPLCFDTLHVGVWPSVLIVLTLLICVGWIQWAEQNHEPKPI